MAINDELKKFAKEIDYEFKDLSLLRLALTHKSYSYEKNKLGMNAYNERIEFLGDAILDLIIAEKLYLISPLISEGDMTKKRAQIVCEKSLAEAFVNIDAENYLLLGKCELATDGRRKEAIIADSFEAVIGAIYLDSGYEDAKKVALKLLEESIKDALTGKSIIIDYKTKLQELLQKTGKINIEYMVMSENGPDHDKMFECGVKIDNELCGIGNGKSRKIAEQVAAKVAYEKRV